jgi:uncharacterized protein YbaA (DUF1428 family)
MPRYVDGFVLPIPKKNRAAYLKMARLGRKIWMEYGALDYHECIADDAKPGKLTSFPQSVMLKKGEEVWFSWIVYKSRRDRDRILKKVMSDPRMQVYDPKNMPFDGKRMIWGGFREVVST